MGQTRPTIWPARDIAEPDILTIGQVRQAMAGPLGTSHPAMARLRAAAVIIGLGRYGEREALYDPRGLDHDPKEGHWTSVIRPLLIELDFKDVEQVKLIRDAIATAKSDGDSTQPTIK